MEWLAPASGLIAAAVAVPLLVMLYFLKLKRRDVPITSTLLWKRAIQDLQVNAPFQKLRRNILLLLQLLTLIAILIALARPVLSLSGAQGKRYVLLIDRSASMNATDVEGTRLEEAKRQARILVDSLRGPGAFSFQGKSDQAMVIAFDNQAKVMCNFTSDKSKLKAAIDAIDPTDTSTSVAGAVTVARAFAESAGVEANNRSAKAPAQLELFSDGKVTDLDQVVVESGEINFHCVGKANDNLAVVAMQARRSYEKPDEVNVFAALANYGDAEATSNVQLSMMQYDQGKVSSSVQAVRSVTIPGRSADGREGPGAPGKASVAFTLTHSAGGVLEVRQTREDSLASDDAAWAALQPPKRLSVLLVSDGNLTLSAAMKACPLAKLDIRTPAEFDAMDHAAMSVDQRYDLIVLDNHPAPKLPRGRFLVLGAPPAELGIKASLEEQPQAIVDWQTRHPVLEHVNLENLYASKSYKMNLPRDARVLAEFGEYPAIALLNRQGSAYLLAGFDVMETNWPFEAGFVMFCYNAVSYLGADIEEAQLASLKVGQAITIQGAPSGPGARVEGPGVKEKDLRADASGLYRYPQTLRAGVYRLMIPDRQETQFAVNLLDGQESDILPAKEIVLSGQSVAAQETISRRTNQEIWPWLVAFALFMVCVEWLVYNSKVRI